VHKEHQIKLGVKNRFFLTFNVCRFVTVRAQPPVDPSQDISTALVTQENGVTTMNFTRPCSSSDSNDISLSQCRFLLYAYGVLVNVASQTISYHGTNRGILSPDRVCFPCGNCQVATPGMCHITHAVLLYKQPLRGSLQHYNPYDSKLCRSIVLLYTI